MRKLWIVLPILVVLAAVSVIGLTGVFAQADEEGSSGPSKLAVKVAVILGIDATEVDTAIKQATMELRDEFVQKKLDDLVSESKLTQQQADEKLNSVQSMPSRTLAIGKNFLGEKAHKRWKADTPLSRQKSLSDGKPHWEGIRKDLDRMIKNGDITREQAIAKLEAVRSKKAPGTSGLSLQDALERLKDAVEDGKITQEQADNRLEGFKARAKKGDVRRR